MSMVVSSLISDMLKGKMISEVKAKAKAKAKAKIKDNPPSLKLRWIQKVTSRNVVKTPLRRGQKDSCFWFLVSKSLSLSSAYFK